MTREQLINKVISAVPLDDISIAKDAVDEYSEQVCCGFAEFIQYTYGWSNIYDRYYLYADTSIEFTTKELYQLYKNKDNE